MFPVSHILCSYTVALSGTLSSLNCLLLYNSGRGHSLSGGALSLSPHLPHHAGLQMKSLAVHSHTASPNAAVPVACIGLGEQLGALAPLPSTFWDQEYLAQAVSLPCALAGQAWGVTVSN